MTYQAIPAGVGRQSTERAIAAFGMGSANSSKLLRMNETNPFQFPTWSQINREQRRRERFKKTVIVAVAAFALLLIGLLILGRKTELAARELRPAAAPPTTEATTTRPAAVPISSQTATAAPGRSSTVYVVKIGDTLTGIAKAHGTTVKAIQTANDLTNDRILVGEQLKIPTVTH